VQIGERARRLEVLRESSALLPRNRKCRMQFVRPALVTDVMELMPPNSARLS